MSVLLTMTSVTCFLFLSKMYAAQINFLCIWRFVSFENLYSPHMIVKYNKYCNGTKNKRKKYNGNAMSIQTNV